MPIHHSELVEVKRVKGKGRGVFARRWIPKGEIIERVPVVVFPVDESSEEGPAWDHLASYCFEWGRGTAGLALGYGSLYNHSFAPNAEYEDEEPRTKVFRALRDIAAGEEITINYNGSPRSRVAVDFQVV